MQVLGPREKNPLCTPCAIEQMPELSINDRVYTMKVVVYLNLCYHDLENASEHSWMLPLIDHVG